MNSMKDRLLFGMKDYCKAMAVVVGIIVLFTAPCLVFSYFF